MSRFQLALDVDDLEAAIGFYERLLGQPPSKRRPGYANFAVANPPLKLVLIENPGQGGRINHLGVEVESSAEVEAESARLADTGLVPLPEMQTTCCYALQDKVWVHDPDGLPWEVYTVLADAPTGPHGVPAARPAGGSCAPGSGSTCCP